jgi:hypothetical protein
MGGIVAAFGKRSSQRVSCRQVHLLFNHCSTRGVTQPSSAGVVTSSDAVAASVLTCAPL